MKKLILFLIVAMPVLALVMGAFGKEVEGVHTDGPSVTPTVLEGNPTCSIAYPGFLGLEYKVDPPTSGTYNVNGYEFEVTFHGDENKEFVNWESNYPVDGVLVKGGTVANFYNYNPAVDHDNNLSAPLNPSNPNNKTYGISHVTFCVPHRLVIEKTVETSYDRDWDWVIEKTSETTELELQRDDTQTVDYKVTLTPSEQDRNFMVEGKIKVKNPSSKAAELDSVTDVISGFGGAVNVVCGVTFPYTLAAGGELVCDYDAELPNATDRTNTATVEVTAESLVKYGATTTEDVTFGDPSTETDECVTVNDDQYGDLGEFCVADLEEEQTYFEKEYSMEVGNYEECREHDFINVAEFTTNDTATTGSDNHTVEVKVVGCEVLGACTLTQGYWKTHSKYGPAPYDDTWAYLLEGDVYKDFFKSGLTYYKVLWTAPKGGDPYYILAHQYIATELNALNGASMPDDVKAAFDAATEWFENYTKTTVTKGKAPAKAAKDMNAIIWAGILADYNEGKTEVPHCDAVNDVR